MDSSQTVTDAGNINKIALAKSLAVFLTELQKIETKDAPAAGKQTFYRGGDLSVCDQETKQATKRKDTSRKNELYLGPSAINIVGSFPCLGTW